MGTTRATVLPASKGDRGARDALNRVRPTDGAPPGSRTVTVEAASPGERDIEHAVRGVLRVKLRGADTHEVAGLVHGHVTFRRPGGPAAWIRCLSDLRRELPQHTDDLEQLAVHAMSCG
ncbi:hypothetical protein ACIA8K_03680 [Catenuloplanes sp. NPDC051500]|uniref:hypothetical protein n=1 Tax=Catenuloplanes sp. NPDC051500 TaxID=3363959 RepID=UPI003799A729